VKNIDRKSSGKPLHFKKLVFSSTFLVIVSIGLIFLLQKNLPPEIPLFYGKPRGVEQLALKTFLVAPLVIALAVTAINIFLSKITKDSFLQKLLSGIIVIVSIMAIFSVYKTFSLVGKL